MKLLPDSHFPIHNQSAASISRVNPFNLLWLYHFVDSSGNLHDLNHPSSRDHRNSTSRDGATMIKIVDGHYDVGGTRATLEASLNSADPKQD